jgi:hypothetical protein
MLDIIETNPQLSELFAALADSPPDVKQALADKDYNGTFFAVTNHGVDSILAWGGFQDKDRAVGIKVERCRLPVSEPELKAPMISALETIISSTSFNFCFQFQLAPLHRGDARRPLPR